MSRALCLLVAAALAACRLPSEPAPDNPYDPLYPGMRIPSAVSDLALADAGPTSVTLRWTDNSSFESEYRVVRCSTYPWTTRLQDPSCEEIATVGADVTTFTDSNLRSDSVRSYQIVPRRGASEGPVTESLPVAYPCQFLAGFPGNVTGALAISSDGRLIAVRDDSGPIRLYDAVTLAPTHTLPGAPFAFSPDGAFLAAGDGNGGVSIYRVRDGTLVTTLPRPPGTFRVGVVMLSYSPDGTHLAAVTFGAGTRIFNLETGGLVQSFDRLYLRVFFIDSERLVTVDYEEGLTVWDVAAGKPLRAVPEVKDHTGPVVFHAPSRQLATSSSEGITIWNVETWQPVRTIDAIPLRFDYGTTLSFDGGGTLVAVLTWVQSSFQIQVFDLTSNAPLRSFTPLVKSYGEPRDVALDASGRTLAVGLRDPGGGAGVQVWRLDGDWQRRSDP